jgi:membrane-bound lytic murein transglycosylase MltF
MLITRRRATATGMAALTLGPTKSRAITLATNSYYGPKVELNVHLKQHTEDLDVLLELGAIRMLAPYSRTFFFEDRGSFHGVSADIANRLQKYVRKSYPKRREEFVIVVIPTSRDRLLPDLLAGWGDVAVGDIRITPERETQVTFTTPTFSGVTVIVVTKAGVPPMASADDLSGKDIAARQEKSSYADLVALNERLTAAGRAPANILDVPPALEVEDMMEMVAAGLLPAIPAERWVADTWAPQIPGLMIHDKAVLQSGADLGWAVRPSNPKLLAMLNAFIVKFGGGSARNLHDMAMWYVRHAERIHAATTPHEMKKFSATLAFFQEFGAMYGFDELLLVAQGYQESRLDQSTRSAAGAIGLMQLLPGTGREMAVGNIYYAKPNVHAGAKYMREMIDKYLGDATFDEQNRALFGFACYNAGPHQISRLRKEAKRDGLDENVWFDNVERVAARRIGQETVRYVRNIYKYYIGYKLLMESQGWVAAAKAQVTSPPATTEVTPAPR